MNKKLFLKAALDGLIQSVIFAFSGTFLISTYASSLSLEQYLVVGLLGATLSTVVYFILVLKESNNKAMICFSPISAFCFVLCSAIMLTVRLTSIFDFLPLREANSVDGILLMLTLGCFISVSIILRACVFVVLIIRNVRRTRKEKQGAD